MEEEDEGIGNPNMLRQMGIDSNKNNERNNTYVGNVHAKLLQSEEMSMSNYSRVSECSC